jgi:hypothetical protein
MTSIAAAARRLAPALMLVFASVPPSLAGRSLAGTLAAVAPDEPTAIDWQVLAGLDYKTGQLSDKLKELNGKLVKVPGFMVPLEDFATEVSEFLLVPYFGACVHTPPPPPNQTVYVKMDGGKQVKVGWWDPVWVEGILRIEKAESVYGVAGFQVVGMKITAYEQ